jgi:hypothetical protein
MLALGRILIRVQVLLDTIHVINDVFWLVYLYLASMMWAGIL